MNVTFTKVTNDISEYCRRYAATISSNMRFCYHTDAATLLPYCCSYAAWFVMVSIFSCANGEIMAIVTTIICQQRSCENMVALVNGENSIAASRRHYGRHRSDIMVAVLRR